MAQGDETVRALGSHDTGEPCGAKHVAFHRIAFEDEIERFFSHQDAPLSDGNTLRRPLVGNIDHAGLASLVDVSEDAWRWGGFSSFGGRFRPDGIPLPPTN
jgi:hypothetical protein